MDLLCVSKEFPALVDAKYEIDRLRGAIRRVQSVFVVTLGGPQSTSHTEIEVVLSKESALNSRVIKCPVLACVSDLRIKYRTGKCLVSKLEVVDA